ncbi:MAG: hypothetical protein WKF75_17305 [Singulisphaera sp.]
MTYGPRKVFSTTSPTPPNIPAGPSGSTAVAEQAEERPNAKAKDAAEELRRIVATVGRVGEPGEQVRCVVSVSMLTEGWDANNVTHILGLRAFRSQLLCEQVVGRGLRRMDYTPDPTTGLLTAEYADVYGIPFSIIPFKGRGRQARPRGPAEESRHPPRAIGLRDPLSRRRGLRLDLRRDAIKADIEGWSGSPSSPSMSPPPSSSRPRSATGSAAVGIGADRIRRA